jgi:hypothetical protein
MTQLGTYRLRFALDLYEHEAATDLITNASAALKRGVPCDIEIALYTNNTFVDDLSNINSITLQVFRDSARQGPAYIEKTVNSGEFGSPTEEQWQAGGAAYCHAKFELDADDTNLDMSDALSFTRLYWFTWYATLTDGTTPTIAGTIVTVYLNGAPSDSVIGSSQNNYRITTGNKLQLLNADTGEYHDIYVVGGAGAEQIVVSEGES